MQRRETDSTTDTRNKRMFYRLHFRIESKVNKNTVFLNQTDQFLFSPF